MSSRVVIRFKSIEGFRKNNEQVLKIIKDDTGADNFLAQPSYPPAYLPPPLSQEAIDQLKALDDVDVQIIPEDA
ncbi:hypothetical protein BP00DRAFT_423658 [Aspergillus indologenus CBS 114.80]|uniref:Uncharacterized protein n=1 Tax=Aspergillus indologenus CBS 114.80 TaxID=1450541 RepID=A0A2V5II07_9EURO|nr:hypothetical protein BP00DRAFT_423658 [Aspergillus indologenus CBS 114.80]